MGAACVDLSVGNVSLYRPDQDGEALPRRSDLILRFVPEF